MEFLNATDVRREWSAVIDDAVRRKPQLIQRTRDKIILSDLDTINLFLQPYEFSAERYFEEDGSVTLSLNEIDLVENAENEEAALDALARALLEYASDFYDEYETWSVAPNRVAHIPYVFKALLLNDVSKIRELITCHSGRN